MKRNLGVAIALAALVPATALSDVTVYGKANLSVESTSEGDDSYISVLSNASRIGLKGSEEISDGLSAIYKFEYETFVDDGDKSGNTFSQRNIYVGLKGNFGQVIAGNFDTPLKVAQGKVDVFNDLRGDIKNIVTVNDNRPSNSVMYSTPSASGFVLNLAVVASEEDGGDDGISSSVTYENDTIYAALGYDQDVESVTIGAVVDDVPVEIEQLASTLRLVLQGTFGPLKVGALFEQMDFETADSVDGFAVSAAYKVGSLTTIKAQLGQSDQQVEGGETLSVGADFKHTKTFKSYAYYTAESADNDAVDNTYFGGGVELKF